MMVSPGVLGLEPVPWGAHWLMMQATKAAAAEAAPAATAPPHSRKGDAARL
jgi:hypothetical protein